MPYTVVGSPISPFVRKVMIFMTEKGIPFEQDNVNPFAPPDGFREISPLGRIPALRHDDAIVNDSSVICAYLERLHATPALYPQDPLLRARAEWIEEYMDGGVVPVAGPKVFAPLVLRPMMTGQEPDETEPRRVIAEELPPFFDYLDAQLGGGEFFVGDALSIADIAAASSFVNLRLAGAAPAADRWPKLHAFLVHMHARPSFQATIQPILPLLGKRWVEL